ncbi:MAG: HD-GYP domain-containing protein [Acidimicrobiales bacterium]
MDESDRRRAVRTLAGAYLLLAGVAFGTIVSLGGPLAARPNFVAVSVFAALVIWAENVFVKLPTDTSVSPSFMVVMAAIAAFDGVGTVIGAAIVGACGGLVLVLARGRRFGAMVINCAQFCLSAIAAAVAYESIQHLHVLAGVLAAGTAFAVVNVALILPAVVNEHGVSPAQVWADMRPALPNYLAFGLLGTLVGQLYSTLGWLSVVLLMTPVVIARKAFHSYMELRDAQQATIRVFTRAIEAKDTYTARHTQRVCNYSIYMGEKLGFSTSRLEHLRNAALMHDIGKLAVPKHLLNKPGKLTDEEFEKVQEHVHVCIDILGLVDFLKPMTAAAAGHHARYDGGGYSPGSEHPIEAYIVAVADAYDAMTSTRAYRRALPMAVAFGELRAKSGTQFHPDCVDALITAIEERGERHGFGFEEDVVTYEVAPPMAGLGSAGLGDRVRAENQ